MRDIKQHKADINNHKNIKSTIAFQIGALILEDMPGINPMIHYFEVRKHFLQNKVTITLYCERPGLLIGKGGVTVNKLRSRLSERLGKDVSIDFFEYEPLLYPIYDLY